jgi:starch synthase (maltosyl-transferring)
LNVRSSQPDVDKTLHAAKPPVSAGRVVIEAIRPSVDGGRFAVKRTVGDKMIVEADIYTDGHEQLAAVVALRAENARTWKQYAMQPLENDRWRAVIELPQQGDFRFRIEAWIDTYGGFVRDLKRKKDASLPLSLDVLEGRELVGQALETAGGSTRAALDAVLKGIDAVAETDRPAILLSDESREAMQAADQRPFLTKSYEQRVQVERKAASFASWYELFPRSLGDGRHGTFRDAIAEVPRIQAMGFDVLYMTPIHPIGRTNRKGRNNSLRGGKEEPGSPYAIGSSDGGHEAVHPDLGTMDDFRALVAGTRDAGMELALDIAVQMSPDHPWLKQHPDWFRWRPDGSMKYAENPPKTYEDIVNPDFYADRALWTSLRDVLLGWIDKGVRIFRVDNPHTKPFPFWEWLIAEIREQHPDVIFLAEAFTRPKRMYHLAKLGFTQSYTYFTWRNAKWELTEYLTELSQTEVRDFFRPHFFVNTPDINPYFLQTGGRAPFLIRAALATTLSGLWGMYSGFEICEAEPLTGREEYNNSEKYELRRRNFDAPGNIVKEITQLNALRQREPALQSHLPITFYNAFNDSILYYGKTADGRNDRILVAVNLDPFNAQECDFEIPLWEWGLPDHDALEVEDLLHGHRFTWSGKIQRMRLEPRAPYAIWRVWPREGART